MSIYDPIAKTLDLPHFFIEYNSDEDVEEYNKDKIIPWNLGIPDTEKSKRSKSRKMKDYWTTERRNEKSNSMIEYNKKNGTKRYSDGTKKRYVDKDFKEKFTKTMTKVNKCEVKRAKASIKLKAKWEDPEYVEKMKNRKIRSGKPIEVSGVQYKSLNEASRETGISLYKLRKLIK